jgi:rhamnosyltransferase
MPLQASSSDTAPIVPSRENICAIVVTYFPDAQFVARLDRIQQQVAQVIVVDNTDNPGPGIFPEVTGPSGVEVISNGQNLGIGAALNRGLARAMELDYGWAITFDQDSWVRPELVQTLIRIYEQQSRPELVGILGCNFEDENTRSSPHPHVSGGPLYAEVAVVITSGSLMPLTVFSKAGPFRSDFFIDFVDHEYSLRLRKLGYRVLIALEPLMVHALGAASTVDFASGPSPFSMVLTNRPPLRRYYMTRNGLLVAREFLGTAPRWILRSVASLLVYSALKIPFEKNSRWKKLRAIFSGVLDAVRNKTGKAEAAWLND